MTPGSRYNDPVFSRRRRRNRRRRKNRRKRTARILVGALLVSVLVLVVSGFTGAAVWMNSCNLNSLKPVDVGENSFVYAFDGSLLGSIPAEKNRQPVTLEQMSNWVPKATVAIEDRRFWQHGALDYAGIVRALFANIRAGHVVQGGLDHHAAARAQPLHQEAVADVRPQGDRGMSRDQALRGRSRSTGSCRPTSTRSSTATAPTGSRLRRRRTSRSARRNLTLPEAALLAGLPQAAVGVRSLPPPAGGNRSGGTRCWGRCWRTGAITSTQYADALAATASPPQARPALHDDPRAVLLQLRHRAAAEAVRLEHRPLRWAQGLHDDRSAPAAVRARTRSSARFRTRPTPPPRSSRSIRRTARFAR